MTIAEAIAKRSKDSSTQVGSVLVDSDNHIIGEGYNGFPSGMIETAELWAAPTKYSFVVHSEANCLLNTTKSPKGATLYCTLYPCQSCARLIAAAQIRKVYYRDDFHNGKSYLDPVSQDIFNRCGIEIIQLKD